VLEGLFVDPMDKWMSNIRDEEWKNVRSIVSTTFTSGKLKEVGFLKFEILHDV
jgi:hypothetical protein